MENQPTSRRLLRTGLRQALDRYFLLLFMILATIAASALVEPVGWGALLLVALQSMTALLAVSTSESPHLTRVVVRLIASFAFSLVGLAALSGDLKYAHAAYAAGTFVLVAVVPITVLRRLHHHRRVTIQTVMGLLCIYLLVGLLFAAFFSTYQRFAGNYFAFGRIGGPSDFIYFSFITLTTVGYGDLVPGSAGARILAVSEALIGQLYLVTVVALAVSNIGFARSERERQST